MERAAAAGEEDNSGANGPSAWCCRLATLNSPYTPETQHADCCVVNAGPVQCIKQVSLSVVPKQLGDIHAAISGPAAHKKAGERRGQVKL